MTNSNPQHRLTNKNPDAMTADCERCGPGIPLKWKAHSPGKRVLVCRRKVNDAIKRTPAYRRSQVDRWERRPSKHHGLTKQEAKAFLAGKCCAVCGTTEDLCVDHCHDTGVIRDPLCRTHNTGLGAFHDSVTELLAAVDYLLRHGKDDRLAAS